MENLNLNKDTLMKLWQMSVDTMTQDVAHEASETPLINSYSIQLPSFINEPLLSTIQLFKLQGDKPKLSVIIGSYIEYASTDITDDEFVELSRMFIEKNDSIELGIRSELIKKAEKNLEMLIQNI